MKIAWDKDETKQVSVKDKTKKYVAFETALFTLVFGGFACFNIYYWSKERAVFKQKAEQMKNSTLIIINFYETYILSITNLNKQRKTTKFYNFYMLFNDSI